METPQILYLITVAMYVLVLVLFLRYFMWKHYACKHYWNRRPRLTIDDVMNLASEKSSSLPYFSILIPARNEADVIANTIEHMAKLNYPTDRFEIIVITDEKELLARREGNGSSPTTQDVVEGKKREFERRCGVPVLKHYSVPWDFDGRLNGTCRGWEVPSTKARALNYGLMFLSKETEICGFYDAESRPERDTLLYIAYRYLETDGQVKLWQGPVFQVRNFFQLGALNKVAAIYQAVAHEWYLPVLMKYLPFVGGTNLFVERNLLESIGGYDHQILSEDLELGARAYLEAGAWPEYFPFVSTEQTPATYRAYFRQRLRWGSGHLQVVDKFRQAVHYPAEKREPLLKNLFWKGQGEWIFYQMAVAVTLAILPFVLAGYSDPSMIPLNIRRVMQINVPIYFMFTFSRYFHFKKYIDFSVAPRSFWKRWLAVGHLVVLPLGGIFFPLPFTTAVILRWLHREPQVWIKTPRTKELSQQLTR